MSAEEKQTEQGGYRVVKRGRTGVFTEIVIRDKTGKITERETVGSYSLGSRDDMKAAVERFKKRRRAAAPAEVENDAPIEPRIIAHADNEYVRSAAERLIQKRMGLMMALARR